MISSCPSLWRYSAQPDASVAVSGPAVIWAESAFRQWRRPAMFQTAALVPPGTFRIGRGGSKGGGELFCAEQKVVQELQRRLGFLHIPQSGAQQPPAHQEGGVLRREPVGRGCLKRVCVQFVLERFLQWFQVVHGCLAQDIHKILCGEQLWRGTLFAGEHQFVLPLRAPQPERPRSSSRTAPADNRPGCSAPSGQCGNKGSPCGAQGSSGPEAGGPGQSSSPQGPGGGRQDMPAGPAGARGYRQWGPGCGAYCHKAFGYRCPEEGCRPCFCPRRRAAWFCLYQRRPFCTHPDSSAEGQSRHASGKNLHVP